MRSVRLTITTQWLRTQKQLLRTQKQWLPTRNNGCPNPNGDRFTQTTTTCVVVPRETGAYQGKPLANGEDAQEN